MYVTHVYQSIHRSSIQSYCVVATPFNNRCPILEASQMQQVLLRAVTEFRQRPLTVVSVLSFLGCIQIGTRSAIASAGGAGVSLFLFRAPAIRLRLGKCGDGLNRRPDQARHHKVRVQYIFALTSNSLFSQVAFQWRIIRPATLVSLHSLGHTRRSMCAVGSRHCVLVSCYKSKIE